MSLRSAEATAYYCDTSSLDASRIETALSLLSRQERARYDCLAHAPDRRDYVAAHALLRIALATHTHTAPEQLSFVAGRYGKPRLLRRASEARPPSFSLSHSRRLVACVIASNRLVGIDVESVDGCGRAADIAPEVLSREETTALMRCRDEERPSRFCELWTLKEALFKALGTGFAHPPTDASFRLGDGPITLSAQPALDPREWTFLLMSVGSIHKLAVAIHNSSGNKPRVRVVAADPFAVVEGALVPTFEVFLPD